MHKTLAASMKVSRENVELFIGDGLTPRTAWAFAFVTRVVVLLADVSLNVVSQ
jgi:hypothetical protein